MGKQYYYTKINPQTGISTSEPILTPIPNKLIKIFRVVEYLLNNNKRNYSCTLHGQSNQIICFNKEQGLVHGLTEPTTRAKLFEIINLSTQSQLENMVIELYNRVIEKEN